MVKEIMREQYSARLGLNRDHSLLVVTIYTYDRDEPTGNCHIGPRPLERSHQTQQYGEDVKRRKF